MTTTRPTKPGKGARTSGVNGVVKDCRVCDRDDNDEDADEDEDDVDSGITGTEFGDEKGSHKFHGSALRLVLVLRFVFVFALAVGIAGTEDSNTSETRPSEWTVILISTPAPGS